LAGYEDTNNAVRWVSC